MNWILNREPEHGQLVIALNKYGDCKLCRFDALNRGVGSEEGRGSYWTGYRKLAFNCGFYGVIGWITLPENSKQVLSPDLSGWIT